MNQIYLKMRRLLQASALVIFHLLLAHTAAAQNTATVKGLVTDERNSPIPGVSVLAKNLNGGTAVSTQTDTAGVFQFRALAAGPYSFVLSYIGYETQTLSGYNLKAGEIISLTAKLKEEAKGLSDVVVVGFGTQKKANLTGAVSTVKLDEILGDRPVTSTSQVLQGAAPGLQVTTSSGQPGARSGLNIRGFTSINGGAPLVLVDNVAMDMEDINPKDIASVTVLKDASSSAIYGARAAFGVILITTKQGGRNQPIKFDYSGNLASTQPSTLPQKTTVDEFVGALNDFGTTTYWAGQSVETWMQLLQQYRQNPAQFPESGIATVSGIQYPLAQNDLYDSFMPGGFEQLHNLSFSGGSEKSNFRVSTGYTNQDGIMATKADGFTRYNLNAYLNTNLTSKLVASLNVLYHNSTRNTPRDFGSLFYNAITFGPYAPTGSGIAPNGSVLPYSTPNNVLEKEPFNISRNNNLRIFGKLEYTLAKGLKVQAEYTFNQINNNDISQTTVNQYINPLNFTVSPISVNSAYTRANSGTNYNAVNIYANYSTVLADKHNLDFVAGTNQEKSVQNGFGVSRLGVISQGSPSISGSTGTITGNDDFNSFAVSGYFGRLNYNYDGKYLFEATGRYDGSSRFPSDGRFGFFPSFSAGWNILEEGFMDRIRTKVSALKLRASYGDIGNQVVLNANGSQNYYPYIPSSSPGNSTWIDPITGVLRVTVPPPSLVSASFTWERVQTSNLGLDFGFFKNRLSGAFEVYIRKTLGMLAPSNELPALLGTGAPLQNVADLKVKGWEFSLGWSDKVRDFRYGLNFNVSDNQAYISDYNNPSGLLNINGDGTIANYFVGQRIGDIWGFVTQGFFTSADFVPGSLNAGLQGGKLLPGVAPYRGVNQNPGDIRFVDLNGDGTIFTGNNTLGDPGDRTVIGNNNRRLQFGLNGNAAYKNFDFSFAINGVGKRDIWISNQVYFPYLDQFSGIFANQLDYWTPGRTDAFYPRSYSNASGNTGVSRNVQTRYLSNGAYIRLKNVSVGYTLPSKLFNNAVRARIFCSAENILTLDHLPEGLDAESQNLGSGGIYPFIKKYSFGANISF
ncbi:SusC/RagA family TonB-linked outer membrane protein [Pedobacter yulinensis]|nr:TonB-dependent receptor [Pedobacter yulinensis]